MSERHAIAFPCGGLLRVVAGVSNQVCHCFLRVARSTVPNGFQQQFVIGPGIPINVPHSFVLGYEPDRRGNRARQSAQHLIAGRIENRFMESFIGQFSLNTVGRSRRMSSSANSIVERSSSDRRSAASAATAG